MLLYTYYCGSAVEATGGTAAKRLLQNILSKMQAHKLIHKQTVQNNKHNRQQSTQ